MKNFGLFGAGTALALVLNAPAFAQDAQADEGTEDSTEIVVTA